MTLPFEFFVRYQTGFEWIGGFFTGELTGETSSKPKPKKTYSDYDDRDDISAPKFEPPPAPPEAM